MVLHIRDFIKDEKNCTPAFVAAVEALGDGDVLCLDGGKYNFYPEGAFIKTYYMSNNDGGVKPIAMPLISKRNVTVDGGGAELVFNGETLPVVIDECENVTLKNFSIDYTKPMYAQSLIVEASDDRTVLKFDGEQFFCKVDENGCFCFYSPDDGWEYHPESALSLQFEPDGRPSSDSRPYFPYCGKPKDHGFLGGMFLDVRLEELGENLIAMYGDFKGFNTNHKVGRSFIQTYAGREFPGIFVNGSKDVNIEEITLYQTISMGIVAQTTENIRLHKVQAIPRMDLGRMLSTGADSTHFVNCRGKVEISHCKFVHMMDDAVNIHGNYHLYLERGAEDTLLLGFGHFQQKGVQTYRVGDTVHIIDSKTNDIRAEAHVVSAELISVDNIRLVLDREVEAPKEYWVVENISTSPEVHIHHTESGFNRPRGFLLSSRGKVLVEKCKFYNMNQGIQLSGELCDWYESGAALDVTIRDNDFTNSAYAGGVAIYSCPRLRATDTNPDIIYSGKLLIENNRFSQAERRILHVTNAADVKVRNNTFHTDTTLPKQYAHNESGITYAHCASIEIEEPVEV